MNDTMNPQQEPEIPVISIERYDDTPFIPKKVYPRTHHRRRLLIFCSVALLALLGVATLALYFYLSDPHMPVAASPSENIAKLRRSPSESPLGVSVSSAESLDVPFDLYEVTGLIGSIEFSEPALDDTSVILYCRSADHHADGSYLGSVASYGSLAGTDKGGLRMSLFRTASRIFGLEPDRSRLGYVAMTNGNMVIGVSPSDDVLSFVLSSGGSFFRQQVILSDGSLPPRFFLHGKVERKALARLSDDHSDRLFLVSTRGKETLWNFAEALRKYGFTDAIYITGGKDYSFCRTVDGSRLDIGDPADYPHTKWQGIIPWLVFRRSK